MPPYKQPTFHYISFNSALLDCDQNDSRGVKWYGDPNEWVKKSCSEGNPNEKFVEGQ